MDMVHHSLALRWTLWFCPKSNHTGSDVVPFRPYFPFIDLRSGLPFLRSVSVALPLLPCHFLPARLFLLFTFPLRFLLRVFFFGPHYCFARCSSPSAPCLAVPPPRPPTPSELPPQFLHDKSPFRTGVSHHRGSAPAGGGSIERDAKMLRDVSLSNVVRTGFEGFRP